jgi:hypothetical protein
VLGLAGSVKRNDKSDLRRFQPVQPVNLYDIFFVNAGRSGRFGRWGALFRCKVEPSPFLKLAAGHNATD